MSNNKNRNKWESKCGEDWVSFVGMSELHRVPSNVAIIAISGNGRGSDESSHFYTRFKASLSISLNSTKHNQFNNDKVTIELINKVLEFVAANVGTGVVFQCGAGEQRSVALAMAVSDITDRFLECDMPGCKGELKWADTGIYRKFRILHRRDTREIT